MLALRRSTLTAPTSWRDAHVTTARVLSRIDVALVSAILVGALVRLVYMASADFPLNDGGLFYAMARDLQRHSFLMPATTSYNGDSIPFAYPPLMVYVIALLDRFTPFDLLTSIRLLPFVANVATIPAFYLLARKLTASKAALGAAVLAFAVLVGAFEWHIMGGGITRAFGFLFAVLAAHQACRVYLDGNRHAIVPTIALASAALLSHPNALAPLAVALLFVLHGRSRRGLIDTAVIAGGVLLWTAPWWASILAREGLTPFIALRASRYSAYFYHDGYPWRALLDWSFTDQPVQNWPAVLGIIGLLACVARRSYFAPAWLLLEFVAEPTQAHNFVGAALALLIGVAVGDVLLPAFRQLSAGSADAEHRARAPRWGTPSRAAVVMFLAFYGVLAVWSATDRSALWQLKALSPAERANLEWIAGNTPEDASFVVVSSEPWWADGLSEWFPALTERHSVFTPQGYEWRGVEFPNRIYWHDIVQECAGQDVICLDDAIRRSEFTYEYVYVRETCCGELRDSIRSSPDFTIVHEDAAGLVARVAPGHFSQ